MQEVVVRTKSELDAARKNKAELIIIEGDLAAKVKRGKKVAYASGTAITVLTVTLAATTATAPVTGGLSYFAAAPVAAMTGFEIATIIAVCFIGLSLLIALFKDYEELEFSSGKNRMILKRKQSR